MNKNRLTVFKAELQEVFDRHGLALWFIHEECYECDGGTLSIVDLAEGTLDWEDLQWHDLAAERAEEARREAELQRIQELWQAQEEANQRLGDALRPVLEKHDLVLWTPMTWPSSPNGIKEVRALPFTEERFQALRARAGEKCHAMRERLSASSLSLAERVVSEADDARLPEFWRDAETAMRAIGLVPVPFGAAAITEDQPYNRWGGEVEPIYVSPRFGDEAPRWLNPKGSQE